MVNKHVNVALCDAIRCSTAFGLLDFKLLALAPNGLKRCDHLTLFLPPGRDRRIQAYTSKTKPTSLLEYHRQSQVY